jgi:hypothetical protein
MSKEYAFPRTPGHEHPTYTGITTRDYFAAKAMQGIISDPGNHYLGVHKIADWAYAQADAMMEARK